MKNIYTKEQFLAHSKQQNINRLSAQKAVRALIETVKQFDGKVYNKRFETAFTENALKYGLKNTSLETGNYGTYLYVRDNDSYLDQPGKEYSSCSYIDYTYYMSILSGDDKRINADVTIPLLQDKENEILQDFAKLNDEIRSIDETIKSHEAIKALMQGFNESHCMEVRSFLSINEY